MQAIACQHFGGSSGEMLRREAFVIANHNARLALLIAFLMTLYEKAGKGLGGATYIGVCVIVGNTPAPAIGGGPYC